MKRKIIGISLVLVIVIIIALVSSRNGEKAELVKVTAGTVTESVEETGYVRASESYDIQAPTSGKIIDLKAVNGQMVAAGQPILIMQNLDLEAGLAALQSSISGTQAELATAKNNLLSTELNLEEARRDQQRKKVLLEAGSVSRVDYEAAVASVRKLEDTKNALQSGLQSLEASLQALVSQQETRSRQVQEMVITSPIAGKILSLELKTGQIVSGGTMLVSVGSPGGMEVFTEILCDDIVQVKAGQPAMITFNGMDQALTGRVKEVYPQAYEKVSALGVAQRRVPVVITLDHNGPLQPGYEVQASIHTASRDGILVLPCEAVFAGTQGEEYVRLVASGRIKTLPVKTGLKNQQLVEIVQGLQKGQAVIRDGSLNLKDGTRY